METILVAVIVAVLAAAAAFALGSRRRPAGGQQKVSQQKVGDVGTAAVAVEREASRRALDDASVEADTLRRRGRPAGEGDSRAGAVGGRARDARAPARVAADGRVWRARRRRSTDAPSRVERRDADLSKREQKLKQREDVLEQKEAECDRITEEMKQQLEHAAGLTREEAKRT